MHAQRQVLPVREARPASPPSPRPWTWSASQSPWPPADQLAHLFLSDMMFWGCVSSDVLEWTKKRSISTETPTGPTRRSIIFGDESFCGPGRRELKVLASSHNFIRRQKLSARPRPGHCALPRTARRGRAATPRNHKTQPPQPLGQLGHLTSDAKAPKKRRRRQRGERAPGGRYSTYICGSSSQHSDTGISKKGMSIMNSHPRHLRHIALEASKLCRFSRSSGSHNSWWMVRP